MSVIALVILSGVPQSAWGDRSASPGSEMPTANDESAGALATGPSGSDVLPKVDEDLTASATYLTQLAADLQGPRR